MVGCEGCEGWWGKSTLRVVFHILALCNIVSSNFPLAPGYGGMGTCLGTREVLQWDRVLSIVGKRVGVKELFFP